jgi:hypothetical protein
MAESSEPRALSAALAAPTFVTRTGGVAMHAASRHVERWAPEASASSVRPLRNLGFVDRLVSPWLEAAQRSASLRMFNQYLVGGLGERAGGRVSWVFPRPWYQDELDWMAAAREAGEQRAFERQAAPTMMTTRGTFVPPAGTAAALPAALYEFVAPSLSVARPEGAPAIAAGADAYSPLVPFAAAKAAQVMARMVAPLVPGVLATQRTSPALRAVLATVLERTALASAPTRIASFAPELVTPPAPRVELTGEAGELAGDESTRPRSAEQEVIRESIARRAQIAELQRVAQQVVVEREAARRAAAPAPVEAARPAAAGERAAAAAAAASVESTRVESARLESARVEARIAERLAEREREQRAEQTETVQQRAREQRAEQTETVQRAREQATEARREQIERAREVAERQLRAPAAARLHEQARDAAARDARSTTPVPVASPAAVAPQVEAQAQPGARELAAAVAALPRELQAAIAASVGQRPERTVHVIRELDEALRAVELLAHASAAGAAFESARGPRLMMPAGLGGLVAALETGRESGVERSMTRGGAPAARPELRELPGRTLLAAPWLAPQPRAQSVLSAAASHAPAALHHVAWADRWLARFAGAGPRALDTLDVVSASPQQRLAALAAAAPGAVLVAPMFDAPIGARADEVVAAGAPIADAPIVPALAALRIDDNAATPDDLLVAISAAATRKRAAAARPARIETRVEETPAAPASVPRETYADLVAQSAPVAPGAGLAAQLASSPFAPALRHLLPLATASTFDVRALLGSGLAASYLAGLVEASRELHATAFRADVAGTADMSDDATLPALGRDPAWLATYVAPVGDGEGEPALEGASTRDGAPSPSAALATPELVSVRSALLALEHVPSQQAERRAAAGSTRALVDALAQPLLAESVDQPEHAVAANAPGMVADRAHAWSIAQERSTADLAFDFVTPELVLAARVYGLGAAEAAQAMRLALVGPGQLAAMASAVDRTFVQMMQAEAERRATATARGDASPALDTAYPTASGRIEAFATPAGATATPAATTATTPAVFGVDRRAPRGAFLWPAATVGALGLTAPTPDGELQMPVAALELIAAQSVAELGTSARELDTSARELDTPAREPARELDTTTAPSTSAAIRSRDDAGEARIEADVVASAAALVPAARRSKFEALYVALARSTNERHASPAARAARAVALAGRGDDTITARERAAIAWDVLPAVYAAPGMMPGTVRGAEDTSSPEPLSTGALAQRAEQRRAELREVLAGESRPGLAGLSMRAGEALGAYVAPASEPSAPSAAASSSGTTSTSRQEGALLRAPTAAPELVQTGSARPAARAGGGEVEIPPWFEAAARRMFDQRGGADAMSATELTLVTSAPSAQIAASSRAPSSAVSPTAAPGSAASQQATPQIDIEKTANEVFAQVLVLIEAARARNGEPYL